MATITLRDSTELADFGKPYIVAELNTSHFGKLDVAREMIRQAKAAGCDCVKFQSWSADTLYARSYYDSNPIASRIVSKFSLPDDALKELRDFSQDLGIAFASTPYSKREVNLLIERCEVPYIKVASMDLNNYPFLKYISGTGCPIVLSTGMGDLEEIALAIKAIESTGNRNICILHCVSIYPPETSTIRLKNILGLRQEFPDYPVGYSDHSEGIELALAAVALGACVIEKHFTLDKTRIGMDNQMAIQPDEMGLLVKGCHKVHAALGDTARIVYPKELEQRKRMRRSIVAARDLKAGSMLISDDFDFKRPGIGFPPAKLQELIGKKLSQDVQKDCLITELDILNKL